MRESAIEAALIKRVLALGGMVRKVSWPGRRGAPDRLVFLPGVLSCGKAGRIPPETVWVELKAPGKTPDPHQEREHALLRKYGEHVRVIDSLEAIEEWLG